MKTETLEEFLARGGKIKNVTVLDQESQLTRDIVLSAQHNYEWLNNFKKLVLRFKAMPANQAAEEIKKLTPTMRRKVMARMGIIDL